MVSRKVQGRYGLEPRHGPVTYGPGGEVLPKGGMWGLLKGNFGRTLDVPFTVRGSPDPGNVVAQLEVPEESDARIMNVTLSAVNEPIGTFDKFVNVEFGNGGFAATAEVDVGRGCTFNVPGKFVRIKAVNTGPFILSPGPPLNFGPPITMGAFITELPGQITRCTRTLQAIPIVVPNTFPMLFPVPPFSTDVTIYFGLGTVGVSPVVELLTTSTGTYYGETFGAGTSVVGPLILSNNSGFVRIFVSAFEANVTVTCVFRLAL